MKKIFSFIFALVMLLTLLPVSAFASTVAPPSDGTTSVVVSPPSVSSDTYANLYAAVQGETNANAHYTAFAAKAQQEGYWAVANLFTATAAAELKHADDEWAILQTMGAIVRPTVQDFTVGTTAENLQAAIAGEYYEYTTMYPGFYATANAEGFNSGTTNAARIFNLARQAEQIHWGNYSDALTNLNNAAYLNSTYGTVYRCPICGAVFSMTTLPASRCPVCGEAVANFISYTATQPETYTNLYAAVQGETNANAHYTAFAAKAQQEGYPAIANLFTATAAAELKHADDEWAILQAMGATARPTVQDFTVGTTAENLQAAIAGEYYEYTTMYPGFLATANAEGFNSGTTNAARIFNLARQAEQIHWGNYSDALANLNNAAYLNSTYGTVYRCPVCGSVFSTVTLPTGSRCPVCGEAVANFIKYTAANPTVMVNGVAISYQVQNGVAVLQPTQEQMMAILNAGGSNIVFDLQGQTAVDLYVGAGWFKDANQTITIITAAGSSSVKTQSLWNNSGKTRLVTVRNNNIDFKNI